MLVYCEHRNRRAVSLKTSTAEFIRDREISFFSTLFFFPSQGGALWKLQNFCKHRYNGIDSEVNSCSKLVRAAVSIRKLSMIYSWRKIDALLFFVMSWVREYIVPEEFDILQRTTIRLSFASEANTIFVTRSSDFERFGPPLSCTEVKRLQIVNLLATTSSCTLHLEVNPWNEVL